MSVNLKKITLFLMIFALSSCGTSAPSTFYALDFTTKETEKVYKTNLSPVLLVASVSIPPYLDKPQIVSRKSNSPQVRIDEFNRWAESLSAAASRVLTDAINKTAKRPYAKPADNAYGTIPYRLNVELLRFDSVVNEQAVLKAWWTITTLTGSPVYATQATLVEPVGDTYDDIVKAQNALLQKLGGQIGQYALKNIKK